MHNVLAMYYCDVNHDDWAELLPHIQTAHNTANNRTIKESRHYITIYSYHSVSDSPAKIG